jgi:hypothetical protein
MRIRDPGWKKCGSELRDEKNSDPGSGINIPDPQQRFLVIILYLVYFLQSNADVIAHEIAHSWTGNLVTNKSFEHFWLNEGFTVFVERKIQESEALTQMDIKISSSNFYLPYY